MQRKTINRKLSTRTETRFIILFLFMVCFTSHSYAFSVPKVFFKIINNKTVWCQIDNPNNPFLPSCSKTKTTTDSVIVGKEVVNNKIETKIIEKPITNTIVKYINSKTNTPVEFTTKIIHEYINNPQTTQNIVTYVPTSTGWVGGNYTVYNTGGPGPVGATGPAGPAGANGLDGATGTPGLMGADGTTTVIYVPTTTTNILIGATNTLQSVVDGIASGITNIINSNYINFATNTGLLYSTINGVVATTSLAGLQSTTTNSLTSSANTLLSNVNGVTSTTSIINSNSLTTSGTNLVSVINGVATTTVDLKNLVASSTVNTLTSTSTGNTITYNSLVNGVSSTSSSNIINSNVATSSGNLLTTIVNGITSTVANIINSFTQTLSGNTLTTTINGVVATSSVIDSSSVSYAAGVLTTNINGVVATTTLDSFWSIYGNGNTNPLINFLGTTDAKDLVFRTNNQEKLRVFSLANPSIGLGVSSLSSLNGAPSSYSGPTLFLGNAANISGSSGIDIILDNDNNSNSGSDFRIRRNGDNATGTTDLFTILETGNIGIGTTTPGNKLEIYSNTDSSSGLRLSRLTSLSPVATGTDRFLTVDQNGDVVLAMSTVEGSVTANNGLSINLLNNIELGGVLVKDTTIDTAGFNSILSQTDSEGGILRNGLFFNPSTLLDPQTIAGQTYYNPTRNYEVLNGIIPSNNPDSDFVGSLVHNNIWTYVVGTKYSSGIDLNVHNADGLQSGMNISKGDTTIFAYGGGNIILNPKNSQLASIGQVLTRVGSNGESEWRNMSDTMWSLTGNAGTDSGVNNFLGTIDAKDLVFKTNNSESMRIGQIGNISLGFTSSTTGYLSSVATGINSFAQGQRSIASGAASFASGVLSTASGDGSIAMGYYAGAVGASSIALGTGLNSAGDYSLTIGSVLGANSYGEIALGKKNTSRAPVSATTWNDYDQLFSIGNGAYGDRDTGNAFSMWKDGSFAFNDDNFQNDKPGTEQNMFYFNYGNHDGMGNAQSKRAIRLGSAVDSEWDINSVNVGDRSIAIGFYENISRAPIASGLQSLAFGEATVASGAESTAIGTYVNAIGAGSFALGNNSSATGISSIALALASSNAMGDSSTVFGVGNQAMSYGEMSFGVYGTSYTPMDIRDFNVSDRLINIGNGANPGFRSDAFTVLKNGNTGIGYNNFETTTFDSKLQVNGSILSANIKSSQNDTGVFAPVNFLYTDIHGKILSAPVSLLKSSSIFIGNSAGSNNTANNISSSTSMLIGDYNGARSFSDSISVGRSALNTASDQFMINPTSSPIDELNIIGSDGTLQANYIELIPVVVASLRELALKLYAEVVTFKNIIVSTVYANKVETKELCVEDICVTRAQFLQMVQNSGVQSAQNSTNTDSSSANNNSSSASTSTPLSVEDSAASESVSTDVTNISTPTINNTTAPSVITTEIETSSPLDSLPAASTTTP